MIFNKEILFLHIPKTGGTSARRYLAEVLKKPTYIVVPSKKHIENSFFKNIRRKLNKEEYIIGNVHADLKMAESITSSKGMSLQSFKKIIGVIRNPYDMELSYYHHLRKPKVRENIRQKNTEKGIIRLKAAEGTFEDFVAERLYKKFNWSIEKYFYVDKVFLPNIHIVKFESLESEFDKIAEKYGSKTRAPFLHINKSKREINIEDIDDRSKKIIEDKYKWIFENGYYPYLKEPNS